MSKIIPEKLVFTIILSVITLTTLSSIVYAQESAGILPPPTGDGLALSDVFHPTNLLQLGAAFVLGGIGWSILGWQKHRRQSGEPISYKRLGKTVLVGLGVGIFALAVIVYTDSSYEHLYATSVHGFLQLTVWAFMSVTTTAAVAKQLFPDAFDKIGSDGDLKPTESSGEKKSS